MKLLQAKVRACVNVNSLHAGMLYRCCSSLKSLSQEFLMVTVRACKVYFLTESSRSCQISKARSSPSTVSFTSMLFNCNRMTDTDTNTIKAAEEKERKKILMKKRCDIKNLTFIMFLKTYACVSVLLSLLGLQIIQ